VAMNCRRVTNLMSAYIDGELSGMEMLEIRGHLSECADCADEYESLRAVKRVCARLRAVAPGEGFQTTILARLDEVSTPPYQRMVNWVLGAVHGRLSPVAAALTASAIALVILSAGGIESVRPESSVEVVASAPFAARVETASYLPELPGGRITLSGSEPLIVPREASSFGGSTFQMAVLNR